MGWSGKKNGELLQLIVAENFSVFLTTDQNISYQQNLQVVSVAVVVLVAPTNTLRDLMPLMPAVRAALATIQPGDLIHMGV